MCWLLWNMCNILQLSHSVNIHFKKPCWNGTFGNDTVICQKRRSVWILNRPLYWCSQIPGFLPRLPFCITNGFCLGCCLTNGKWTGSKNFPVAMGTCWSGLHFSGELQQDWQLWTLALSLHASLHSGIEPRFLLLSSLQIICCLYKNICFCMRAGQ